MNIVLVHGIFDDGRLFNKMADFLSEAGCKVYIPALKPADARLGVKDLSQKLKDFVDCHFEATDELVFVGFSLGCLITRYYLQELGGNQRCKVFHAISGPLHGSWLAYLFYGQGAIDLRPGSEFLVGLQESEHTLRNIKLYSYRTPFDLMIIPSMSSHWDSAENHVTKALAHRLMLRDKLVLETINLYRS